VGSRRSEKITMLEYRAVIDGSNKMERGNSASQSEDTEKRSANWPSYSSWFRRNNDQEEALTEGESTFDPPRHMVNCGLHTTESASDSHDCDTCNCELARNIQSAMKRRSETYRSQQKSHKSVFWRLFSPEPTPPENIDEDLNAKWFAFRKENETLPTNEQEEDNTPRVNGPLAMVRKAGVAVTGTTLVTVGVPLVIFPVPGPGIFMVFGGLYLLSTEFEIAEHVLRATKEKVAVSLRRFGVEVDTPSSEKDKDT
jgi:uncharacterized protein (TIGR02611 family)